MLGAAVLHALWNVALASADDTHAATAVALCAGALLLGPPALAFGSVSVDVWPYVVASAALELAYFGLLATAYARADLSLVYPLSRGLAPVLVLAVSVAVLGADVAALQAIGVVGVGFGVLLVRDMRGRPGGSGVALSLAVAGAIAGYTLVDNEGIEHADPFAYLALVLMMPAAAYLAVTLTRRPAAVKAAVRPRIVLAGFAMVAAYALVLAALDRAAAAPVAAVRESSVLIATLLAGRLLAEHVTPRRLAGAAAIVAGVAAIALG